MAAFRKLHMKRRRCAPRRRRLLVEQFEPRQMLSSAPSGTDQNFTILESSPYTFTAAVFGFSDPGDTLPNSLVAVKFTTRSGLGVFTLAGAPVAVGQFVTRAEIDAGILMFTPAAGGNGPAYAGFTFQVKDDGGTANGGADLDPTPNTFTIDVTPRNSAPSGRDNNYIPLFKIGSSVLPHTFTPDEFGFSDSFDIPPNNFSTVRIATLPEFGSLTNHNAPVVVFQRIPATDIAAGHFRFEVPGLPPPFGPLASFTFQVEDDGGTALFGVDLDPTPNVIKLELDIPCSCPVSSSQLLSVLEDNVLTFLPANFLVHSPTGVPQNLKNVRIETLPAGGALLDGFTPVAAGTLIPASRIADGQFRYIPPPNVNSGNTQPPTFTYRVEDDNGLDPTPFTVGIQIQSVNDAPIGLNRTAAAFEDADYTLSLMDFAFSDPNDTPQNLPQAVQITSLPATGALTRQGVAVPAGEFVSLADITAGLVRFTPAANAHGPANDSLTFRVQDDGGVSDAGRNLDFQSRTLTFDVTPRNDPPSGTDKAVVALEDTTFTFSTTDFGFSDPLDSPPDLFAAVRVTKLPASGLLTSLGIPLPAGVVVLVTDIAAGHLRYTPHANFTGSPLDSWNFLVIDNGGTAVGGVDADPTPNTITINVTPVNDPPSGFNNLIAVRDCGDYIFSISDFGFHDPSDSPPNNFLAVKISTTPTGGTLALNGAAVVAGQFISASEISAGQLRFNPAPLFAGQSTSFTFQVQDDGTASGGGDLDQSANTLSLRVSGHSGAPPFPLNIQTNSSEDVAYVFLPTDFPLISSYDFYSDNVVSVTLRSLPTTGALTLNGVAVTFGQTIPISDIGAGRFRYTPPPNAFGLLATFSVEVLGDGGTCTTFPPFPADQQITINVVPVNDPPNGTDKTVTTPEDTAYSFQHSDFGFEDFSDLPQIHFLAGIVISSLPPQQGGALRLSNVAVVAGQFIPTAQFGGLSFTPAANTNSENTVAPTFTFQVKDNGGITNFGIDLDPTPNTLTINVTSVNDAPAGTDKTINPFPQATLLEDGTHPFTATDFGFSDPNDSPANGLAAVKITTLPTRGWLTLGGVIQSAAPFSVPFAGIPTLSFVPAPHQFGFPYTTLTFQVQDDGGTAHGGIDTDQTPNTITFNVGSVNDPPSGRDRFIILPPGVLQWSLTVADFGFSDLNDSPSDSLLAVKITTIPDKGSLTVSGTPVVAGQLIPASQIAAATISFAPAAGDFGYPYASFTFQVVDNGAPFFGNNTDPTPNTYAFVILGPYPPPNGSDTTITLLEDGSHAFAVADFYQKAPAINPPPGGSFQPPIPNQNNLLAVKIAALPAAGTLKNAGVAVAAGELIPAADIVAGRFVYTPPPNDNGSPLASFTFQVQDNGGAADGRSDTDPTPNTITFNVQGINDAPTGTDGSVTLLEDSSHALSVADFGFTDPNDTPFAHELSAVFITTLPTNGDLFLRDVRLTPPVPGPGVPIPFIGMAVVPAASIVAGELRFVPAANANGPSYSKFTFQVQDSGGTFAGGADVDHTPNTITFNVTPVNDPPSGADRFLTTFPLTRRTFFLSDFGYTDPHDNPANDLRSVVITSLPAEGSLRLSGNAISIAPFVVLRSQIAAGAFQYDSTFIFGPDPTFTFRVQDEGGTAHGSIDTDPISRTFYLFNYQPPNSPPHGTNNTIQLPEDATYAFQLTDFPFTEFDPFDNLRAVKVTTLPAVGALKVNGLDVTPGQFISVYDISLGRFTYSPPPNFHGLPLTSFSFQLQDDSLEFMGGPNLDPIPNTLTFNVTPVNDPPIGTDRIIFTPEDVPYIFNFPEFGFSDPQDDPDDTFAAIIIASLPLSGTLINANSAVTVGQVVNISDILAGQLRYAPPPGASGVAIASFSFFVMDDGGTASGGIDLSLLPNTITIDVVNCLRPPIGQDKAIISVEDQAYVFSYVDFGLEDPFDIPPNRLQSVKITTLPAAGLLTNNGIAVVPGQIISLSDLTAGRLQFQPAANAHGAAYANFDFQVIEDVIVNFCGEPSTFTITFNVLSVNDPPIFLPIIVPPVSDESGPISIATHSSVGPPDEAGQNVTQFFVVGVSNADLFSVPPQFDELGNLTFTPMANAQGTAQIALGLKDDGGTANGGIDTNASQTLTIEVLKAQVGHNALKPLDTSGDGMIVAGDALDLINFLNAFGAQPVPGDTSADGPYFDCNGDGFVTAADALEVINHLNAFGPDVEPQGGEGEFSGIRSQGSRVIGQATVHSDMEELTTLLAIDLAAELRKKKT